jgi:hypothetical protein
MLVLLHFVHLSPFEVIFDVDHVVDALEAEEVEDAPHD